MTKYLLSYTAASLRRLECLVLAKEYQKTGNWQTVRRQCIDDDILMLRLESSRKRVSGELIKRLKNLNDEELEFVASCEDAQAQNAILWIAICRTYEFVRDFTEQVVAVRWVESKRDLPVASYESFFEESSEIHPELAKLAESTRPRLRNQLYQMLREMEFIDNDNNLKPYLVPDGALRFFGARERGYFPTIV